jgi:hypothetical protein
VRCVGLAISNKDGPIRDEVDSEGTVKEHKENAYKDTRRYLWPGLTARRLLQKTFWPKTAPDVFGKRVANLHGLAAVKMSREYVKDGTSPIRHIHWPDVLKLHANALKKFFQRSYFQGIWANLSTVAINKEGGRR